MAASDSSKPDETISAAVAPRDGHRRAAQADDPRATEAPIEINRIGATDRLIHRMPLVPAVVLMVLGIGLAEWLQPRSLWWLALPAGALCVAATVALAKQQRQWSMIYGWLALLWIGATVHFVQRQPSSDELGDVASRDFQPLVFRVELLGGAIWSPNSAFRSGDPTGHRWRTQWKVRCYQVRDGANWRDVDCRSTLSVVGRIDDLWPGDRLLVFGNCARVSAPSNPGQNDLRPIFRSEGQFVFLRADSADQMERIDSSWRRPLARWLAYATYRIDRALHTYVALDQGALASALVFGQRQQVDWYAQQQLLSTGTLHMLAISGMHIELVAGALWIVCLLGGVPLRWTLLVVATVVVLYGLIAGANPPVLRAVFMVLAVCAARWRGRRRGLANLLAFSGLAVLSIRTTWLANVGVQLSFLAVATIAIFVTRGPSTRSQRLSAQQAERMTALASVLEESWNWRKRLMVTLGRWSWQMTCLSFWVWLMTAPLIWSNFHVVSPVAIPLNIVLWPLLVISLLSGLALAVLWWIPLLASLLGFICGGSLWLVGLVVYWGDRVAGGHVWLPAPSHGWLLIFYALAAGGIGVITIFPRWRSALGVVLCSWVVIGMIPWWCGPRGMAPDGLRVSSLAAWSPSVPEELRLTFIDVGHGTSVVAELPTGEVWLYDAGHLGSADRSHQQIADVLWSLPTARIDRLFLSHADADHYNAVPGLLQRFRIGQVAAPSAFWQHLAPELGTLRQTLQAYRVPRADLAMGDQARLGQVRIEALHPPANWLEKTDNANSLTLLVEYAGRRCLLPGDLEKGGLARLLASPPRTADILMAPHHGSLTHDPLPLIQWSQPSWIVISGGARACRPEVIQRYTVANTTTAITHRDGAIQFRIAPSGSLHVWHWHENQWLQWSD